MSMDHVMLALQVITMIANAAMSGHYVKRGNFAMGFFLGISALWCLMSAQRYLWMKS